VIDQGIINKDNHVVIKDGCYIGINSVIVGNVTIGTHAVIGANSVVTKDIPDYSVAVGIPAKVIKQFNLETKQWERCK
jgi:acetyltransferase-like isoleucine patch superfamily enzyme